MTSWSSFNDSRNSKRKSRRRHTIASIDLFLWMTISVCRVVKLRLSDLREHVRCIICRDIIRETRTISVCMHRFCKECIESWLRTKAENDCPHCRQKFASRRDCKPDPQFDRLVSAIFGDLTWSETHDESISNASEIYRDAAVVGARLEVQKDAQRKHAAKIVRRAELSSQGRHGTVGEGSKAHGVRSEGAPRPTRPTPVSSPSTTAILQKPQGPTGSASAISGASASALMHRAEKKGHEQRVQGVLGKTPAASQDADGHGSGKRAKRASDAVPIPESSTALQSRERMLHSGSRKPSNTLVPPMPAVEGGARGARERKGIIDRNPAINGGGGGDGDRGHGLLPSTASGKMGSHQRTQNHREITSRFKGVQGHHDRFWAVSYGGGGTSRVALGPFDSEELAAKVHDLHVLKMAQSMPSIRSSDEINFPCLLPIYFQLLQAGVVARGTAVEYAAAARMLEATATERKGRNDEGSQRISSTPAPPRNTTSTSTYPGAHASHAQLHVHQAQPGIGKVQSSRSMANIEATEGAARAKELSDIYPSKGAPGHHRWNQDDAVFLIVHPSSATPQGLHWKIEHLRCPASTTMQGLQRAIEAGLRCQSPVCSMNSFMLNVINELDSSTDFSMIYVDGAPRGRETMGEVNRLVSPGGTLCLRASLTVRDLCYALADVGETLVLEYDAR